MENKTRVLTVRVSENIYKDIKLLSAKFGVKIGPMVSYMISKEIYSIKNTKSSFLDDMLILLADMPD
jgi:hypothetical protein